MASSASLSFVFLLFALFAMLLVASATDSSTNVAQDDADVMEKAEIDAAALGQEDLNAMKKKKKGGGGAKKKNGGGGAKKKNGGGGANKKCKPKPSNKGKMEIAIQDEEALMRGSDEQRMNIYKRAKQIGATWVRQMFYFGSTHPCTPPSWIADVSVKYDRLVKEAHAAKLKVHIVLTGVSAAWGTYCNVSTGNPDISTYKAQMRQWVQFFGSRGVRRFSTWNEPNLASFMCAGKYTEGKDVDHGGCSVSYKQNAKKFLQVYKAGYKVIRTLQKKNHWKKVQIFLGEYAGFTGAKFTELLLKKSKLKADGFSWHPYQYCNPPSVKGKGKFLPGRCKRAMNGMGYVFDSQKMLAKWAKSKRLLTPQGKRVPLYLTEFGYHRDYKADGVPEGKRANWYAQALSRAKKAKAKGFVLFQFYPQNQKWDTSLFNADGTLTKSFRRVYKWARSKCYKVAKKL
jgi:hypothetical protein